MHFSLIAYKPRHETSFLSCNARHIDGKPYMWNSVWNVGNASSLTKYIEFPVWTPEHFNEWFWNGKLSTLYILYIRWFYH